ncbi:ABC transporter permease [Gemmatimonas aurantiaca]|uniref:ABC transporter permease n=1 Tax=Gemmatimonas aurantiaca TaxID=173480 RepID=UPI00301DDC12
MNAQIRIAAAFEWRRLRRSGSFVGLAFGAMLLAFGLMFTARPDDMPWRLELDNWLVEVSTTVWFAVMYPLMMVVLGAQVGATDIATGAIRLPLLVPGMRRVMVFGKFIALTRAAWTLAALFFVAGCVTIFVHAGMGTLQEPMNTLKQLARVMVLGVLASTAWWTLVLYLAIRLRSATAAGGVAFLLLLLGWIARGHFGALTERRWPGWWGVAVAEHVVVLVPAALTVVALLWSAQRAMRSLEVR